MCGIAGLVRKNRGADSIFEIESLTKVISHRGPDGYGYHYDKDFAFGHRRLSIIDLSDCGKQPMYYLDYIITYNGEIYNYLELKQDLILKGYQFTSHTDTEVILASYDCWGKDCVCRFNGMWAFAIFDKKNNIIFSSRDRFGIKPFYYTEFNAAFYFGSEIKQFTVLSQWESRYNKNRVFDYFVYGVMNHTNETLFDGVFQLPGGNNLIYDLNCFTFKIEQWYNPTIRKNYKKFDRISIKEEVKRLFFDSVQLRLRSDVKVGSCLSGGIDSSSIVCTVNKLLSKNNVTNMQETVSACYKEKEFSEEPFIDIVINQTKAKSHKVFPSFDNLFTDLDRIIWFQDEPFTSTSIFAQWNVFKEASSHKLTVMLDGQGADEYLAGYDSFYGILLANYLTKGYFGSFITELRSLYKVYGIKKTKIAIYWVINCLLYRLPFIPEKLRVKIQNNVTNKTLDWFKLKGDNSVMKMNKVGTSSLQKMSDSLLKALSVPTLLHSEDRNSMAFSIESRVPFLDYRLVEFVMSLPNKYKIHKSVTKHIFREAMTDVLPESIKNRKDKVGFSTPQEKWILENSMFFRNEIEKSCKKLSSILNTDSILNSYDECIKTKKGLNKFWNIICFARWSEVFKIELLKSSN